LAVKVTSESNFENIFGKVYGCLAGLAVGDALGAPVEMLTPSGIKRRYGFIKSFVRAPDTHPARSIKPGSVTDDTLTALFVARLLIKYGGELTAEVFGEEFVKWFYASGLSSMYFWGPSTRKAVDRLANKVSVREAGDLATTCGAAVRAIPAGLVAPGDIEYAARMAAEISLPTHGSSVAVAGAAAVASAVSKAMESSASLDDIVVAAISGSQLGWRMGREVAAPSIDKKIVLAVKLARGAQPPTRAAREIYDVIGMGMEAHEAVPSAIGILIASGGHPMRAILLAVNTGGDTDTVAAIAGAIGGAWHGVGSIDQAMLTIVEKVNKLHLREVAYELSKLVDLRRK
jgi:ADP-ribosylglycohydrolase